jgi:hypothetical protein
MKRVEAASSHVLEIFQEMMDTNYPELNELGVTFNAVTVVAVDKDGMTTGDNAIIQHGVPVAACIRKTNAKERALGLEDLIIEIDWLIWLELTTEAKYALADHELAHVEINRDKNGLPQVGVDMRPKLKLIPHDAEIGIFYNVIERHGIEALDFQMVEQVKKRIGNLKIGE